MFLMFSNISWPLGVSELLTSYTMNHVCFLAPAGVKLDEDVLETPVISGDVTDDEEEADDEDDNDDDVGDVVVSGTSAYKT